MNSKSEDSAKDFLENEKQFHLGVLPTEQSNPKTRNIDDRFKVSLDDGIRTLLSVDYDVAKMAAEVLSGKAFSEMIVAGATALKSGGNIVLSGCGATGRISILLESIWRGYFLGLRRTSPRVFEKIKGYGDRVFSIMTGGDYALIKSVENFEDYAEFGRQQVRDQGMTAKDVLIAITEGGETSSVLGTVDEAADRGARVFLLFNNPADILCAHVERSRKAIIDPRVTVLDLHCGPMAIAGSTRMQATTSEQLIAGAALETILNGILKENLTGDELRKLKFEEIDYRQAFPRMLDQLNEPENIAELGRIIRFEADIYGKKGLITYFAEDYLLDIFTDTTERSPTFALPPFRKCDDQKSSLSWAFVKNPRHTTPQAWEHILGRHPRCLQWNQDLYRHMGAPAKIIAGPPCLTYSELLKFIIGNEPDKSRTSAAVNAALMVVSGRETSGEEFAGFQDAFTQATGDFQQKRKLIIGQSELKSDFRINYSATGSTLRMIEHLAIKLTLNTLSTGTMIVMGRVTGNWMSWVDVSNKKLRDRGIRLICELCGLSYRDACYALHETLAEFEQTDFSGRERPSPVQQTIRKLNMQGIKK